MHGGAGAATSTSSHRPAGLNAASVSFTTFLVRKAKILNLKNGGDQEEDDDA